MLQRTTVPCSPCSVSLHLLLEKGNVRFWYRFFVTLTEYFCVKAEHKIGQLCGGPTVAMCTEVPLCLYTKAWVTFLHEHGSYIQIVTLPHCSPQCVECECFVMPIRGKSPKQIGCTGGDLLKGSFVGKVASASDILARLSGIRDA